MSNLPYYPTHPDIPVGDQPGSTPWPVAVVGGLLIVLLALISGSVVWAASTGDFSVTGPLDCTTEGATNCQDVNVVTETLYTDLHACDDTTVCLVPLGSTSFQMIESLVQNVGAGSGLYMGVLPPIAVPSRAYNSERGQYDADDLMSAVVERYGHLDLPRAKMLVVITPVDMYVSKDPAWSFAFSQSYRVPRGGSSLIISTAHMSSFEATGWSIHLPLGVHFNHEPDHSLTQERTGKVLLQALLIDVLGLPPSADPHSVLYANFHTVQDLDRMTYSLPTTR